MELEKYEKAKSLLEDIENLKRIRSNFYEPYTQARKYMLSNSGEPFFEISGKIAFPAFERLIYQFKLDLEKGIKTLQEEFDKL